MKRATACDCPRVEALSSMLDGEIAGDARREIETHAASCAVCGSMLRDFRALRTALGTLGAASACVDIAAVVDRRLPAHAPTRPVRQTHGWRWQLLPAGFAAAGVLVTGAYLGMLLEDGAAIGAARSPAVAVFDAVPPGGLCVPPVCYGR